MYQHGTLVTKWRLVADPVTRRRRRCDVGCISGVGEANKILEAKQLT